VGGGVRVYPNASVRRVVAFVPPGHMHVRLVLELEDQTLVLQEATVAAIVRAYASVALHPSRRAVELVSRRLGRGERKPLFAEWQLVESGRGEEEVIEWALGVLEGAETVEPRGEG